MVHFALDGKDEEGEVNPSTNTLATCGLQCRQGRRTKNNTNNDCLEDQVQSRFGKIEISQAAHALFYKINECTLCELQPAWPDPVGPYYLMPVTEGMDNGEY